MRVVVFGAGAIGSLLGARLVAAGHEVVMVGRPAAAERIRTSGLVATGRTEGTFRPAATASLAAPTTTELVLLTVKAGDVREAGRQIASAIRPPVPVVALQNGLGIEEVLARGLSDGGWPGAERWVVRAINSYGATLVAPCRVHHAGDGEILLPSTDGAAPPGTIDRIDRLLRDGGFAVRRVTDLPRELWRKALVNAAVNPVTAQHGVANGDLLRDPLRGQAENLLKEALATARLEGQVFSDEEADRDLWRVVRATAENRSSMLQDLDRGRPTEIDEISGSILRAAQRHGLDLPHTRRAIEWVRRRESERAGSASSPR